MKSRNFAELCNLLAKTNREIVLFIGSGINSHLIKQWGGLLYTLLESGMSRSFERRVASNGLFLDWILKRDPYEQANLIRRFLGKQYLVYLHKELYAEITERSINTNKSLKAFADLCQNQRVHAVVTYNYDDLLEYIMNNREESRKAYSVFGRKQKTMLRGQLPVFHVHGYVPWRAKISSVDDSKVILAREEYHEYMIEPFAWQTTVQLDFLRSYVCLYFGASLTDMNMVRIASHALHYNENNSVYSFEITEHLLTNKKKKPSDYNEETKSLIQRTRSSLLSDIGIKPIFSDNVETLYRYVNKLKEKLHEGDNTPVHFNAKS